MMKMSMRWYGTDDPVSLKYIRQIPGMVGIVSALHDLKPGEIWTVEHLQAHQAMIDAVGLRWEVVESIPVHEAIKIGLPERDQYIENYQQSIRNMGTVGIPVLCYNFMPVFDWMRTDLAMIREDGSTALSYHDADLEKIDLSKGTGDRPAWITYDAETLNYLREMYQNVDEARLFDNLAYFLKAVVPVAAEVGVRMAIHPDDPPWSIFGLPRIVRDASTIQNLLQVVDSPYHGLTFCTGSLGVLPDNDLPAIIHQFADRINFVHARNVRITGERSFHEVEHPSAFGQVNMRAVMQALIENDFTGPIRPDHGRMIWGEQGRPGYGLYDRALGAMYLQGLIEGIKS